MLHTDNTDHLSTFAEGYKPKAANTLIIVIVVSNTIEIKKLQ